MKTGKLISKQLDFLSQDKDSIQWNLLSTPTRDQAEHLLSELMLSAISQNASPVKEDHDVQN